VGPRRERRPGYCARPPIALERIAQVPAGRGERQVVYRRPLSPSRRAHPIHPHHTGVHRPPRRPDPTALLSAMPATRACWHPKRRCAPLAAKTPASAAVPRLRASAHYLWAASIARLFLTLPLVCHRCGADACLPAGRCASVPSPRKPPLCGAFSPTSAGRPGSPPRADRRPGTTRWSLPYRTGRPSLNRHPSTALTSQCSGSALPSSAWD
jgi:hypothetical protein